MALRRGVSAFLLSVVVAVSVPACGYHPLGTEALPPNVRSIGIGPVGNQTFRPGLQALLAEALRNRLLADGRVRLVPSTEADAVLETVITSWGGEGVAWDVNNVARRIRVLVTATAMLRARLDQKILFTEGAAGEAYYTTGSGVATTLSAEDDATRRAVRDVAERIGSRIIQGF